MSAILEVPTEHTEETNARILSVSEDRVKGFTRHPFQFIAEESGVDFDTVVERIRAMLKAGVIRRVRQTLLANKLAVAGRQTNATRPPSVSALADKTSVCASSNPE